VIHLYAFAAGLERMPAAQGIDDAPVESRSFADVVVLTTSHAALPRDPRRADVIRHGAVVAALLECTRAVLPARFGEDFGDEAALEAAVNDRLPALRNRLAEVGRHVEIGVRVLGGPSAPRPAGSATGADYLRSQLPALRARELVDVELHRPLGEHAAAHRLSPSLERAALHTAAYLVARDDVGAVTTIVERFAASHPELTVVCTGPWAPYSFAEAS
jgi:hypothetical protein